MNMNFIKSLFCITLFLFTSSSLSREILQPMCYNKDEFAKALDDQILNRKYGTPITTDHSPKWLAYKCYVVGSKQIGESSNSNTTNDFDSKYSKVSYGNLTDNRYTFEVQQLSSEKSKSIFGGKYRVTAIFDLGLNLGEKVLDFQDNCEFTVDNGSTYKGNCYYVAHGSNVQTDLVRSGINITNLVNEMLKGHAIKVKLLSGKESLYYSFPLKGFARAFMEAERLE
jgi:hypothetical protein